MKIDIYSHILTPKYMEALKKYGVDIKQTVKVTSLWDLDERFSVMDKFDDLRQVITPGGSPDAKTTPAQDAELARLSNDEVAEVVARYPDRFVAAAAVLPLKDPDEMLKETDRAIKELKFKGVHLPTPAKGKPVDRPEFLPLYEKMQQYDLPIWLHPTRPPLPDYAGEEKSLYDACLLWGWPCESSIAMTRLILSGIMDKFPRLKMVIHHAGGMVPFFTQRVHNVYGVSPNMGRVDYRKNIKGEILDYFRRFYVDTALNGSTPALTCAHSFYGTDHMVFGTDMPYDEKNGLLVTGNAIEAIDGMALSGAAKKKIYETNAKKLLNL